MEQKSYAIVLFSYFALYGLFTSSLGSKYVHSTKPLVLLIAVTPRLTDSTREFENLSNEAEELCHSSFFLDLCNTYLELSAEMLVQCCLNRIEP